MSLPRVLIFGQPFNNRHGGGITLSNMFRGWDKDKLAVAATGHVMYNISTDICDTYYQLGALEHKWRFPFNIIQREFKSGLITVEKLNENQENNSRAGLRYLLVNRLFYPIIKWLGLYHFASRIILSDRFKRWLDEFCPNILYIQVSSLEDIFFASQLIEFLKIPTVIHMMDDWPSTISEKGLFKKYWHKKIDQEFRHLLERVDLFLSISNAMTKEYKIRYKKDFIPFHNPIDLVKFSDTDSTKVSIKRDIFSILYLGRIGVANSNSIQSFAKAVSQMNVYGTKVELEIFTPTIDLSAIRHIISLPGVKINPPIKHEEVPSLMQRFNALLLPLDFSYKGIKYARYSMPTKASEYMISGIPIIVFAPNEMAITQFCTENKCGYCITNENINTIIKSLLFFIQNEEYRKQIGRNAVFLAKEIFDGEKVRGKFRNLLTSLDSVNK